jgi:hypothetical protein
MMTCKETSRLLSESHDRELLTSEYFSLKLHLFMCSGCTQFNKQIDFVRSAGKRHGTGEDVGRGEKNRP